MKPWCSLSLKSSKNSIIQPWAAYTVFSSVSISLGKNVKFSLLYQMCVFLSAWSHRVCLSVSLVTELCRTDCQGSHTALNCGLYMVHSRESSTVAGLHFIVFALYYTWMRYISYFYLEAVSSPVPYSITPLLSRWCSYCCYVCVIW